MSVRIKICGISDCDTAQAAVTAGADAVGLNFHAPSSRYVSTDQAASIVSSLPAFISSVAVVVNPEPGYVRNILSRVRPDYLQFHGDESAELCRSFGTPYIRAIRMRAETRVPDMEKIYPDARALLLDTYDADQFGGTGDVFNWTWVESGGTIPVILAGGLNAENVGQAISTITPWAVDVSSGVETGGMKDPEKMNRFCQAVHALHSERGHASQS